MIDADAFAKLLCDWCLDVRERDHVLVSTTTLAAPLIRAVHRELITRGAWAPGLRISIPGLAEDFYRLAGDELLDDFHELELAEIEHADAFLRIDAPENTRALADVDPAVITRASRARAPISEVRLGKRWCGTQWPTPALAQQAGMSDDAYAAFLGRALFLDRPDPVAAWRELSDRQALGGRSSRPGPRDPDRGRRHRPAPARRRPHLDQLGRPAQHAERRGVHRPARGLGQRHDPLHDPLEPARRLGRGRRADVRGRPGRRAPPPSADRRYLDAALATDPGARFLGELGIGTNSGIDRATGSILLDEKMAGTVHLALGRSYPETGGRNASALHWDLICDLRAGGRLTADGETVDVA